MADFPRNYSRWTILEMYVARDEPKSSSNDNIGGSLQGTADAWPDV